MRSLAGRMTFRTHRRKILGDLANRRSRTALVSVSIFIGVLGVIALFTVRDLISQRLREDLQQDRLTMLDVTVNVPEGVAVDDARYLATLNRENETGRLLEDLDGIERVEGQAFYPLTFRHPDADAFFEGELRAYGTPLQEVQLEPMRLLDGGTWPEAGRRQVALEQRMAQRYGFVVGDQIVFRASGTAGEHEQTFTVSGLVFHPYSFKRATATGQFGFGPEAGIYANYDDARSLLGFTGLTAFVARFETFEQAERQSTAFQQAIRQHTPYLPILAKLEDPAEALQLLQAASAISVLSLLALVSMFVSGFLVVNVINVILVEQKNQIGVMKILGASVVDNALMYTGIALVYGVLGTLPALAAGIVLGDRLSRILAPLLDVLLDGFDWSPSSVIIGATLGMAVPLFAAALPVYHGVRVSILDAIADYGISDEYGTGRAAHIIGALPVPLVLRQAVSNVYRRRRRLALTGATLTVALAAFMGVLAIGISLDRAVQDIFDRLGYQILVRPNEIREFETIRAALADVDGVASIAPGIIVTMQIDGQYQNFFTRNNWVTSYALDPAAQIFHFDYQDGDGWSDDPARDGVVITAPMAKQLSLAAGDSISFRVSGRRVTREVIGIDDSAFDTLYMEWEQMARLAGIMADAPRPNEYVVDVWLEGRRDPLPALGVDDFALSLVFNPGLEAGQVLISRQLAENEDLQAGDTVRVSFGDYNGRHTIAGVIEIPPQIPDAPDEGIAFRFDDLVSITGASTEGQPLPNGYFVTLAAENPTITETEEALDRVKAALLASGITGLVQNQLAQAQEISAIIGQFIAILLLAAILIAAVGAVGLLTTLVIAVIERQKEIGVMRSIGAGTATIAAQFLAEGIVVGALAWLAAMPLSVAVAFVLKAALNLETVAFSYPPVTLAVGFAGMFALAALASLWPSIAAACKTVAEILRYQ